MGSIDIKAGLTFNLGHGSFNHGRADVSFNMYVSEDQTIEEQTDHLEGQLEKQIKVQNALMPVVLNCLQNQVVEHLKEFGGELPSYHGEYSDKEAVEEHARNLLMPIEDSIDTFSEALRS